MGGVGLDTAESYTTGQAVGEAIKESGLSRNKASQDLMATCCGNASASKTHNLGYTGLCNDQDPVLQALWPVAQPSLLRRGNIGQRLAVHRRSFGPAAA